MKLILKITAGIILAVILLAVGCSVLVAESVDEATEEQTWTVEVSAPSGKRWSGSFGQSSVDGTGSRTVEMKDISISGATAQKQSEGRWRLALTLRDEAGDVVDQAATTAQFGVVSVSGVSE